jgi:signal transduction histidine kinase
MVCSRVEPVSTPATSETAPRIHSIAELITARLAVKAVAPMREVVRLFEKHPGLDSLAVLDGPRIGMVSRSRFFLQLGRRFGYSLFENRPVSLLAEEGSTVEATSDPVEVITLATQREDERIYDDILVVDAGQYVGTVSMRSLLAHHKDLLIKSIGEVALLGERARHLEEVARIQSEFVANMTHELRTPVNTVLGLARVMADSGALPLEHQAHVRLILSRGQELLTIVNNMLDLSKLDAGALEPLVEETAMEPLLTELCGGIEPLLAGRPVRLRLSLRSLPAAFHTDPVLVKRIVSNLLGNAAKFTDMGSITLAAEGYRDTVTIWVRDTGPGIPREDQERLFQRFVQLEATKAKRHQGTGLGLAIVKGLTDLLGGSVFVQSEVGRGTTFTVRLVDDRSRPAGSDGGKGARP